jgi:hypothetical protein
MLFSAFLFVSACSTVGSEVQAGRNALQTGHPIDAIGYLDRQPPRIPITRFRTGLASAH